MEMALYHILWTTLIIISLYKPPANVSPISPPESPEGEAEVSPSSLLLSARRPRLCRRFMWAGNGAEGLDVRAFALFMCGI